MKTCLFGKNNSSAKVIDEKLVLSFPGAVRPVLWHMELAETKSCAFEIRDSEAGKGPVSLMMKNDDNDPREIAAFPGMEEATEALMAISSALEKSRDYGTGRNVSDSAGNAVGTGGGGSFLKAIGVIAGILLLFMLVAVLWSLSPRPPSSLNPAGFSGNNAGAARETVGEPVSADDFFKGM